MNIRRARWLAAAMLLAALPAHGFAIEQSRTSYVDKHFRYELVVTLDAPIDRVDAVLRDYAKYPSLDPRILQARVLSRPEKNVALLETTLRACVGPFCRNVTRVERVEESHYVLHAVADPARSDVKFSETRSELSPSPNGGTRVKYVTNVIPGFWVPAIAGRRWMLNTLESVTSDLFMNVEMEAKKKVKVPDAAVTRLPHGD